MNEQARPFLPLSDQDLPQCLRDEVTRQLAELLADDALAACIDARPDGLPALRKVVACSPYAAEVIRRYPGLLVSLVDEGLLDRPLDPGAIRAEIEAGLAEEAPEAAILRQLRLVRHRHLLRVIWRDLVAGTAPECSLADLSALADDSIRVALDHASTELLARHGTPRDADGVEVSMGVVAMGKLGGGELNFSSDVDLVFVYSDAGETDGPRPLANEEYFRRLAQRLIDLLGRKTAEGFVYRVDARLRPFGDSGPLALSLPALETYLVRHGRDWERYAWIKARVVNDWPEAGSLYKDVLRPFIYRRYLDYGVFSSLREMKALIEDEVRRGDLGDNIKLGAGGIREVEFIAQSIQLVRGGTLADLRQASLLRTLEELARHGCLPDAAVSELGSAYRVLRLAENRIQAMHDRQTHELPASQEARERLVLAMGMPDWATLERELNHQRERIHRHFRQVVFRGQGESPELQTPDLLARAWSIAGQPAAEALLTEAGFAEAGLVGERLASLRGSSLYARMDEIGRQRLDALVPALLQVAASCEQPLVTLDSVLRIIEAIGRRSAYFALLNENPAALERLASLCTMSDFLVSQLARHPLLLDELLDPRVFQDPPGREELAADLAARRSAAGDDIEQLFNALRNFQQAATFRIAVTDLSGALPLMKVSDRLTDIAELVLEAALQIAWSELVQRHGRPLCEIDGTVRAAEFGIVAYGKLGGLELGYGSDLDLVFLHDSEGESQLTDGERPLDNGMFFGRLARRIISILTLPTPSGTLYEVDVRLRPSGRSGLLVSSLAAFERYEFEEAWTWEHQALLRGRAVAGSARVGRAFEALRTRVLCEAVRRDTLRGDVLKMRERMRSELPAAPAGRFDIKQDPGGITDIEFIVQYLVLAHGGDHPRLTHWPDNIRQLEALADHGLIAGEQAGVLAETYRAYRQRLHRLKLAGAPGHVDDSELREERARVRSLWDELI
ncbi:MAG: bifunctional [glutamate--ammonia ligase]-adenylyl-L-tyrosine phosphorylase/[glutamate--ammonia-ligase] adenylyltransferase [Chromatiales bacterium]|nr:bifunctional [glutamate--ammonia ligase]-adenylyl-L-tyrosine phosphorylase/[glutamate--ammonia-ligase] adenylyltransferase [Chromatiales bacterium]